MQKKLKKANSFIVTWIEVIENKIEVFAFYIDDNKTKESFLLKKENLKQLLKKT